MNEAERARLMRVIERASAPTERMAGRFFRPVPPVDAETLGEREEAWQRAVADGDLDRFTQVLQARTPDPASFRAFLYDAEVLNPEALPPWATVLLHLMSGSDSSPLPTLTMGEMAGSAAATLRLPLDTPWRYQAIFAPFLHLAQGEIEAGLRDLPVACTSTLKRRMLAHLARSWAVLASPLLTHRLTLVDILEGQGGVMGQPVSDHYFGEAQPPRLAWLALMEFYPVMGYLLAVTYDHWRAATRELLDRLRSDLEPLATTFFGGQPLTCWEDYDPGVGDPHDHGRSVAILTFDGGRRLLYKPKPLQVAAAFADLLRVLNAAGLPLDLRAPQLLPRASYLWEEFVQSAPCATEEAVERFYRRLGMHLRLLQLLQGRDFICDNLRACGEWPILIDLENLLCPTFRPTHPLPPLEARLQERLAESVLAVGILPVYLMEDAGQRGANVGVLGRTQQYTSPFKVATYERDPQESARLVRQYVPWQVSRCFAMLEGEMVDPLHHVAALLTGYGDMDACLRRHRTHLSAPDGPIARLGQTPVRYRLRHTHLYDRLLQHSYAPNHLKDGLWREIYLEQLWKRHLRRGQPAALVEAEIEALRRRDIPLLSYHPTQTALLLEGGEELPDIFAEPVLTRVLARLQALDDHRQDEEMPIICSALATLHPDLSPQPLSPAYRASRRDAPEPHWLEEGVAIGDALLGWAISSPTGEMGWLGLGYHPWADTWTMGALQPNLLTGLWGPTLLFADLYRLTGLPRFQAATLRLLLMAQKQLEAWIPAPTRSTSKPLYCGAFYGVGATLYTLARGSEALGEAGLLDIALVTVERFDVAALLRWSPVDMVSGQGGLLLALLHLTPQRSAPRLLEIAGTIGQGLHLACQGPGLPRPPYPDHPRYLERLPGTEAGVALALHRLGVEEVPLDTSDFPPTVGSLLTRLALPHPQRALVDATHSLVMDPASLSTSQLLESLEVALTAYQRSAQPFFRAAAARAASEWVGRRREYGTWFYDLLVADQHHLSAVSGLTALAHVFLKLHAPSQIASLRLLG